MASREEAHDSDWRHEDIGRGAILLADRQETITDYAKWDQSKIKIYELVGEYRVAMAAAGQANTCDMIWDMVMESLPRDKGRDCIAVRDSILNSVLKITKKRILPFARRDRPVVDAIWVTQSIEKGPHGNSYSKIDAFRTYELDVNQIPKFYFGGSPLLLTKFLSDMYLRGIEFSQDEAEALAAYILWEAKEYDPNCGKHNDILLIRKNGTLGRQTRQDEQYWENHFEHLKEAFRFFPVVSCATARLSNWNLFNLRENLAIFRATLQTLFKEQLKWRKKMQEPRSALDRRLQANIEKVIKKHGARRTAQVMRLASRRSKPER